MKRSDEIANELSDKIEDSGKITGDNEEILKGLVYKGLGTLGLQSFDDTESLPDSAHRIDKFITEWRLNEYDVDSVIWGIAKGIEFNVNKSETKALCWCADEKYVDHGDLKRKSSPDYVVSNSIGIEVKRSDSYSLRRKQIHAAARLQVMYVVVSNERKCEILDTIDWIGLNEYDRIERA
jgi:hypothetical protein